MFFKTASLFVIASTIATSTSAYPVASSGSSLEARYTGQPCVTSTVCGAGEECVRSAGQLYGECHPKDEGYSSSHHLANHAKPKHKRDLAPGGSSLELEARYTGQPCVTSTVCGAGEECVRSAGQLYGECHPKDEGYSSSHHLANHAKPKHKRDLAPGGSSLELEARYTGQPCVTSAVCGAGEECVRSGGQLYGECHPRDEGYSSSHHLVNHAKAAKPKHKRAVEEEIETYFARALEATLQERYTGQPCVTSTVCGAGEECVRSAGQLYGECHPRDEGYSSSHHLVNHAKGSKHK